MKIWMVGLLTTVLLLVSGAPRAAVSGDSGVVSAATVSGEVEATGCVDDLACADAAGWVCLTGETEFIERTCDLECDEVDPFDCWCELPGQ